MPCDKTISKWTQPYLVRASKISKQIPRASYRFSQDGSDHKYGYFIKISYSLLKLRWFSWIRDYLFLGMVWRERTRQNEDVRISLLLADFLTRYGHSLPLLLLLLLYLLVCVKVLRKRVVWPDWCSLGTKLLPINGVSKNSTYLRKLAKSKFQVGTWLRLAGKMSGNLWIGMHFQTNIDIVIN